MSSSSRGSTRVRPSCTPAAQPGAGQAVDADVLLVASWPAPGGPRAPSSVWPSRLLSPPAVTGRVSAPAWSAAWSTACRRRTWRRPRSWASAGRARATPHRRGAAPTRADLVAGARPGPRSGPRCSARVTCPGVSKRWPYLPRASLAASRAHRGPARRGPRRPHDVVMAACWRAQRDQAGRPAADRRTEPDPGYGSSPGCVRHRPAILVVDDDSYETASRVRDLDPGLPIDDLERIERVVDRSPMRWTRPGWSRCAAPLGLASSAPRLPVPAGRARPCRRRLRGAARRHRASHRAGRGGVRGARHCPQRAARTADQVAARPQLGLQLPDGVTVVDHRPPPSATSPRWSGCGGTRAWTEEMARDQLTDPITSAP